jgi:hypothetical protein
VKTQAAPFFSAFRNPTPALARSSYRTISLSTLSPRAGAGEKQACEPFDMKDDFSADARVRDFTVWKDTTDSFARSRNRLAEAEGSERCATEAIRSQSASALRTNIYLEELFYGNR